MLLSLHPAPGFSWGEQGHRIIGMIAEHYLTDSARRKVADLLVLDATGLADSTSFVDESVWADRFRDSDRNGSQVRYHQTQAWHYVDLEVDRPDMDSACANHACIVEKIDEFRNDLADGSKPPAVRLLALQFLLHLVGDIHQPLHAADRHDRGGNDISVASSSKLKGTLHHYWDSEFVAALGSPSEVIAQRLTAEISASQLQSYRSGSVIDWAYESFAIARREVYAKLPPADDEGVRVLDDAYTRNATAVVALQIQRAGVRLAAILNDALR